jgi:hypothetical protein
VRSALLVGVLILAAVVACHQGPLLCSKDGDCISGSCSDGVCTPRCNDDEDCPPQTSCEANACERTEVKPPRRVRLQDEDFPAGPRPAEGLPGQDIDDSDGVDSGPQRVSDAGPPVSDVDDPNAPRFMRGDAGQIPFVTNGREQPLPDPPGDAGSDPAGLNDGRTDGGSIVRDDAGVDAVGENNGRP